MVHINLSALVIYGLCLTPVVSAFPPPSVVAQPGDNVTFHCTDVTGAPGHVGWFKQDNGSEPICIASMYSSEPTVQRHNGFQPSHMEMFISHRKIFLKITEVDVADSGVYFCGMFDKYIIFTNVTVLKVQGNLFNNLSAVTPTALTCI
uniref:Ig-like domain-containing protein n=1 Tax=Oncorhynchus mykiss TaxID=8022 RepID=A0A8C7Q7V0_ONCMY